MDNCVGRFGSLKLVNKYIVSEKSAPGAGDKGGDRLISTAIKQVSHYLATLQAPKRMKTLNRKIRRAIFFTAQGFVVMQITIQVRLIVLTVSFAFGLERASTNERSALYIARESRWRNGLEAC